MRHCTVVIPPFLVLLTALAHAQQPAQRLEFEVASIKLSPPQPPGVTSTRTSIDKSRLQFTNVTVKEVVEQAYRILQYQIEGPDWTGSERFDIAATIPEGAPKDSARIMLQ